MRRELLISAALALGACGEPRDSDRRDGSGLALVEQCTSQARGATAFDDDLDGAIDEGCPLHFGVAAPLAQLHRTTSALVSPHLSDDKLRLYVVRVATAELVVAHRTSRDAPFDAPVVAASWEDVALHGATLSTDELEVIVGAGAAPLARATRESRDAPFGPLEPITLTVAPPHFHPAISRDGRELFFVATDDTARLRVYRAVRDAAGAPFGPAEAALVTDVSINEATPSLSEDGRTLYLSQNGALSRAVRAGLGSAFEVPEVIGGAAIHPFESASTRELFFVTQGQPWSPVPDGTVWRAPICRDGPCATDEIPCDGGVRSADLQHCYTPIRTPLTWPGARVDCEERGAHLATISSADELLLLASLHPGLAQWLGGTDAAPAEECNLGDHPEGCEFTWLTGEAWLYAPWAAGEPSGAEPTTLAREDCVAADAVGTLADASCEGVMLPFACESERSPSW